jgi:hypothetical protein
MLAIGVATAMGLLLTGCGRTVGSPAVSSGGWSPTAVPASPTPNPRSIADQEAVDAYVGMLHTWVEAAKTANPESVGLRQYAQGDALKDLVNRLYGMRAKHMVALGEPATSPSAIDARPVDVPTTVVVHDCLDDSTWLQYKESGELWDDKPGQRYEVEAIVVRTGTGWMVDGLVIRDVRC